MKSWLLFLTLALLLTGCRIPGHVYDGEPAKISIGMTRSEVTRKFGNPESSTIEGKTETMGYTLERPWFATSRFQIKIVDGKVQSFEVLSR